jgi:hypothetical protein
MHSGRSHWRNCLSAFALFLFGAGILPAVSPAAVITPHASSATVVKPHVVDPAAGMAEPPPAPAAAAEEEPIPEEVMPATPEEAMPASAGPSEAEGPQPRSDGSPSQAPQSDGGCYGSPGCRPCPGVPGCTEPDPRDVLRPPESAADRDRRAICSGWRFGIEYLWGDFVYESYIVGRHLEVSRLNLKSGDVLYSLPSEAEVLIQLIVRNWNYNCATWLSP